LRISDNMELTEITSNVMRDLCGHITFLSLIWKICTNFVSAIPEIFPVIVSYMTSRDLIIFTTRNVISSITKNCSYLNYALSRALSEKNQLISALDIHTSSVFLNNACCVCLLMLFICLIFIYVLARKCTYIIRYSNKEYTERQQIALTVILGINTRLSFIW